LCVPAAVASMVFCGLVCLTVVEVALSIPAENLASSRDDTYPDQSGP